MQVREMNRNEFRGDTMMYVSKKFKDELKKAIGLTNLTDGETYAVIRWCGVKALGFIKGKDGKSKYYIFNRYDLKSLLKSHYALMKYRQWILEDRIEAQEAMNRESESELRDEAEREEIERELEQRFHVTDDETDMENMSRKYIEDDNYGE